MVVNNQEEVLANVKYATFDGNNFYAAVGEEIGDEYTTYNTFNEAINEASTKLT